MRAIIIMFAIVGIVGIVGNVAACEYTELPRKEGGILKGVEQGEKGADKLKGTPYHGGFAVVSFFCAGYSAGITDGSFAYGIKSHGGNHLRAFHDQRHKECLSLLIKRYGIPQ